LSKATSVSEETRTLFYYWEGDWPGHPDAPQFFGKGEIVLEDAQRATGYFTIRSDGTPDPRERKTAVYRRADSLELEALKSPSAAARSEVIRKRLEERAGEVFGPSPGSA
jgi:hypothetical protein